MTRLAVLADIHGNLPALEAVRRAIAAERVDRVIVLGDSVHWGPSSAAVVDIIRQEGWAVIRGNNEMYLLDYGTPRAPAAWSGPDYAPMTLLREQLAGERHAWIASWPDTLSLRFPGCPPVRAVHGSPRSHWEALHASQPDDALAEMLAGVEESYVLAGHTHLAMDRSAGPWRILNPGSVGLPLDGTYEAQYLLLDGDERGWRPEPRRVSYDRRHLFETFERLRFVERCGVVGELIVEEFRTSRIQLHPFVRWRDANAPGQPLSSALLDEYRRADPRPFIDSAYHVEDSSQSSTDAVKRERRT